MLNRLIAGCLILAIPVVLRAQDPAAALRERYLGPAGLPSETAYAQAHEIYPVPGSESTEWQVTFRLAYREVDAARLSNARPVHTDCYFVRTRKYMAAHRPIPVWDGRVYQQASRLIVAAYTHAGEKVVGQIDGEGNIVFADPGMEAIPLLELKEIHYNPFTGQLWRRQAAGHHEQALEEKQAFYLPLGLVNLRGERVRPEFRVEQTEPGKFALMAQSGAAQIILATCSLADASDLPHDKGYSPVLGPGCTMAIDEPTIVLDVPGEIVPESLDARGPQLVLKSDLPSPSAVRPVVQIDGRFNDWRNLPGIADPQADIVSYLQYTPDTDLVEFKVHSDEEYLYFYTRVVGRHGNTAGEKDRYYFYVYIDADRNPATGYVPTRDDNCYYGVALGDDCEAQYEFIDGRFVKTFYGFAGGSTETDVLNGRVTLAPSWYSKHDEQGRIRDGYKVEYICQADQIQITKDYMEGTSDDISIAISPDGSECEMRAALSGFLRDANGRPTIAAGQRIDLAAGLEAAGRVRNNSRWGADSTATIRGYQIGK